ncbi:zinc finger protein 511 [Patella vulgata]|uniref:zinc finger protein 511 n=1 Tax=Patella vulgata TaxID=6465 RepID=UPI00217F2A44|nr:zinc finger protein 511 [Patella vulgata]
MDVDNQIFKWRWYPVKRRLQPEHILFEAGDKACHQGSKIIPIDNANSDDYIEKIPIFPCSITGCGEVFDNISRYESHYNTLHRNICTVCRRVFPSNYLLEIHLQEWHDAMFEILAAKQNMYQCLVEHCLEKFKSCKQRKKHMVELHHMPANYRFDKVKKNRKAQNAASKADEKNIKNDYGIVQQENKCMEDEESKTTGSAKRIFSYKVPKNICFGQGSARGFSRPGRGRGKHWHQTHKPTDKKTTVNIENIVMTDLTDALNVS